MTKIEDKLKRLHGSRIRALDSNPRNEGVYVAEPQEKKAPKKAPKLEEKNHRFASILRNQTLRDKSKAKSLPESKEFGSYKLRPQAISDLGENGLGDRIKDLRIQAGALIDAGRHESALPFLFEILAFVPQNAFALSKITAYFRMNKEAELAEIFEKRLDKIANY